MSMSDPQQQTTNASVAWANSFGCLGIVLVIALFLATPFLVWGYVSVHNAPAAQECVVDR